MYDSEYEICPFCGHYTGAPAQEPYHLAPETLLGDRYIIGNVLGFGGFGITYKAWDKKLDSVVAIKEYYPSGIVNRPPGTQKLLLFSGAKKKEFEYGLIRFIDEARNMTKFNAHKNIVNVYEYFEENNTAYIVMEFLDGCTLGEYMEKNDGKLSLDRGIEIILHICDALKDVHENGIIHRDISPDNIFMCKDGTIKLIDFGAARFSSEEAKNFTIILKPGFAPPEQYEQVSDQGPKTDIYAVGATLYYMLTGVKPDESTNRKIKDILEEPIKLDSSIPQYISDSILKAMAIEAHLRFETVEEFEKSIKKEIKVTSLKKEKRKKKIKRFVGIASLALIVTFVASVFFLNMEKQAKDVTLEPATISVWYINNADENLDDEFKDIISVFCKEYKDVKIDAKGFSAKEYTQKLNEAIEKGKAPNLFVSNGMTTGQLSKMLDLSSVIYPDTDNKLYFLTYILASKNPTGCYSLDDYNDNFPEHKQMPTGFNVPVIYVNTSLVENFTAEKVKSFDDIKEYITDENKFLVSAEMKDVFTEIFAVPIEKNIIKGSKEQFVNGQAAFYFSDTSEYFDAREITSLGKGESQVVSIDVKDLQCEYSTYWSVSQSKENENAAAIRFLTFLLSPNAQTRMFGRSDNEHAIPLNKDAIATIAEYIGELSFIDEDIKGYKFGD